MTLHSKYGGGLRNHLGTSSTSNNYYNSSLSQQLKNVNDFLTLSTLNRYGYNTNGNVGTSGVGTDSSNHKVLSESLGSWTQREKLKNNRPTFSKELIKDFENEKEVNKVNKSNQY